MTGALKVIHDPNAGRALHEVYSELERQVMKWGLQSHPNGTGGPAAVQRAEMARDECDSAAKRGTLKWRHILSKEVTRAFAETDARKLRAELIQVAAAAVQWALAIERG